MHRFRAKVASTHTSKSYESHRPDIQGLRALAVLLVVAFHANFPLIHGGFIGVDVFFVISGFLITGGLLRELEQKGKINFVDFWARRARRLLPAATLVLVLTLVASLKVLPLLQHQEVSKDVLWASFFMVNWRFAMVQTDYWSTNQTESPILHYWSLGVEEQFYFVWPLLLGLTAVISFRIISRRDNPNTVWLSRSTRATSLADLSKFRFCFGIVCTFASAISFWNNLSLTSSNQPFAYFGTTARVWQLATGGLIAVCAPALARIPNRLRGFLFQSGLVMVVVSAFLLTEQSFHDLNYPGLLAAIPTLATGAILAGGMGGTSSILAKPLCSPVALAIGAMSYALYLIHWPLLVLGHSYWHRSDLVLNVVLVSVAFPAAWVITKFVENPIRFSHKLKRSNRYSLQLAALSLALVSSFGFISISQAKSAFATTAFVTNTNQKLVRLRPSPATASQDYFALSKFGCSLGFQETVPKTCMFGDESSLKSVLLLGDSHASAIFPAVQSAALRNHWKLYVWEKNSCPISDVTKWDAARKRAFLECNVFRKNVLRKAAQLKPNLVVIATAFNPESRYLDRVTGQTLSTSKTYVQLQSGFRKSVSTLTRNKIPVIYLHEPPFAPFSPADCLIAEGDVNACQFSPPLSAPEFQAARELPGVSVLDLYSAICNAKICNPVKGDILVYRDQTHMTKTYVLTLTPKFNLLLRSYE